MADDNSALPNIFSVAATWAQLVALVPMLIMYDNSEVEIMNTNIPDYKGMVAFLGQSLALALVAVTSVKRIFNVNESAAQRKKKSIRHQNPFDDPDIYFRVAELLDRKQCVHMFVCSLAFRAHNNESLTPEQATFIGRFMNDRHLGLWSNSNSTASYGFQRASLLGQTETLQSACSHAYPRCQYSVDLMTKALTWAYKLQVKDLRRATKVLREMFMKNINHKRKQSESATT